MYVPVVFELTESVLSVLYQAVLYSSVLSRKKGPPINKLQPTMSRSISSKGYRDFPSSGRLLFLLFLLFRPHHANLT